MKCGISYGKVLKYKYVYGCSGDYGECEDCITPHWSCAWLETRCPVCGQILRKTVTNIGGMVGFGPDPPEYVTKVECPNWCNLKDILDKEIEEQKTRRDL